MLRAVSLVSSLGLVASSTLLALLGASGCDDKRVGQGPQGPPAQPPAVSPPPSTADELIRHVSSRGKGRLINELVLRYVRSDGTMDPTYSSMSAMLSDLPPPPPADDPNRPVGAPPPPAQHISLFGESCVGMRWSPGGEVAEAPESFCGMPLMGKPVAHQAWRCSASQLWRRALEDGAPEGLATLSWTLRITADGAGMGWEFSIVDAPRNISFKQDYPDDCAPEVERQPS